MSYMITVTLDLAWVADGTSGATLGQNQSNEPGFTSALGPGPVPGAQSLYSHRDYEKDGFQAHWRGIYDDHGRIMVAICHNMDLGDSWEHADDPAYPERHSSLGMKIATNYLVYSMTH